MLFFHIIAFFDFTCKVYVAKPGRPGRLKKKNNIKLRAPEIRACQEQTQPRNSVKSKSISAKKLLVLIEKGSVEQTT